ncbi:MAG: hypothetical protein WEC80_01875 [Patescibacteria group bacterium]
MDEPDKQTLLTLSKYTQSLVDNFKAIKQKERPSETDKITVSPTVSLFAIAYEKLRNVIQYREESIIRRSAIERIIKRRLALNPEGKGEAENLIRELLWARYFANESLGQLDVSKVQEIIDKYLLLKKELIVGRNQSKKNYLSEFVFDLMTCEIEEALTPVESETNSLFTFYIYQVLRKKVKIEGLDENSKNAYFFLALDKTFNKSDLSYLRYHLFTLYNEKISTLPDKELKTQATKLVDLFDDIDKLIKSTIVGRVSRFVRTHIPPFRVLFQLFNKKGKSIETVIKDETELWKEVEKLCREKYEEVKNRLNNLALKAIIYIFLTKMIVAFIVEYPVSLYYFGEVNYLALTINTIFPPFLMFILIGLTKTPTDENTKKLFERIIDIVDADRSFETTVSFITKKPKARKPSLIFGFTVFYTFTFFTTFIFLYLFLDFLGFNIISQLIFVLFISLVSYFAYRIRKVAKQYTLQEKEGIFRPFLDIFFMPILSLGQFLSRGLAKLNFLTVFFDFIIEAPFKVVIEVVEEWISFVRSKREEIE